MHDKDYMIQFGLKVKDRRKEMGLTQTELAERIGYSKASMISYIESGKKNCSSSLISILAKALECEPSYLMGWNDLQEEDPVEECLKNASAEQLLFYQDLINKLLREKI